MKKLLLLSALSVVFCSNSSAVIKIVDLNNTNNKIEINKNYNSLKAVVKNNKKKFKDETLVFSQSSCFLNTISGTPIITILNKDGQVATIVECGCRVPNSDKNTKVKKDEDIAFITPLETIDHLYTANKTTKHIYEGKRSGVRKLAQTMALATQQSYQEHLMEQFQKNTPMCWTLKSNDQITAIRNNIERNIKEEKFVPTNKTLLLLKLPKDPKLESIDDANLEFLGTYFEVYPITDKEVVKFFEDSDKIFGKICGAMGGSKPEHINEGFAEVLVNETEKAYEKYDPTKLAILAGTFVTVTMFKDEIKALVRNGKKKLTGGHETLTDKFFGPKKESAKA